MRNETQHSKQGPAHGNIPCNAETVGGFLSNRLVFFIDELTIMVNDENMDKRTPHYALAEVHAIVRERGINVFSRLARENGLAMGLTSAELVTVVLGLTATNFYKSMTTYHDHTLWQDVYHAETPVGKIAYIKVTVQPRAIVIQFKEK